MAALKKLLGQTAIYGTSSIIGRLLYYFLTPIYTRIFLTEEYGIVTELFAYVGFFMIFLTFGMETTYFRFSSNRYDEKKVFNTSMLPIILLSAAFVIILTLFSQSAADYLKYHNNPEYIIWFALIIGLDALTALPFARLRKQNKPIKFATIKFLNIGTNVGINLFFLVFCRLMAEGKEDTIWNTLYSKEFGVGYIFIANLVASLLSLVLLYKEILSIRFSIDKKLIREMFIFSAPLVIVGFSGMINEALDRILLKEWTIIPEGADSKYIMSQLGIYGANYKLSIFMTLFIQAFRYGAEPFFFSHAKEKNSKQTYADVMKYFIIAGLFIFLGVTLYIDIAKHFIGEDYRSGLSIVPILLLANLFLGIIFNLSIWYKLNNLTKFGAIIGIIGATITILLNYILIPKIGFLGSAWATFFCYLTMMVLSYLLGQKHYKINYDLKSIFIYSALAIGVFFIAKHLEPSNLLLKLTFNTALLALFALIIAKKEIIPIIKRKRQKS